MVLKFIYSNKKDGNMAPRFGDKSLVLQNKKDFFNKNNIDINKSLKIKVTYSDNIFILDGDFINQNDLSSLELNTDSIITKEPNIFLYLYFADCIPMAMFDKKNNVLAFAHMGWQSIELDLHKKIINTLKEKYNTDPSNIEVILGPSIKKESYILKTPSQLKLERWKPFLKQTEKDYYEIDLSGYLVDSLKKEGISDIEINSIDTAKDNNYFSHYRCVYINKDEKEGRFIVGAMIE